MVLILEIIDYAKGTSVNGQSSQQVPISYLRSEV